MGLDEQFEIMHKRYGRFMECVRRGDANAAAEEFARFCRGMQGGNLKISMRTLAAFTEAWIELFWQGRRHDMMLQAAEDAEELFGPDPEWSFARGEALFNLGRFEETRATLEALTTEDFEEPMLFYLLGCLAEREGKDEDALRLFQTANRLDPKNLSVPEPIDEEAAVAIYNECLEELPDTLAWELKDVPVYASPLPSDELLQSTLPPIDPLAMGLFIGQPMGEETSSWASDQPRILLFHKNIAKAAGDIEALHDELRRTLFHEVGHYFGFDEDQLEEMGLA